jgi:hypothetical protein
MHLDPTRLSEIKRKMRKLKRLEETIRFNGSVEIFGKNRIRPKIISKAQKGF